MHRISWLLLFAAGIACASAQCICVDVAFPRRIQGAELLVRADIISSANGTDASRLYISRVREIYGNASDVVACDSILGIVTPVSVDQCGVDLTPRRTYLLSLSNPRVLSSGLTVAHASQCGVAREWCSLNGDECAVAQVQLRAPQCGFCLAVLANPATEGQPLSQMAAPTAADSTGSAATDTSAETVDLSQAVVASDNITVHIPVDAAGKALLGYTPGVLNVTVGTVITWVNDDPIPHTVTDVNGTFDSGTMMQGDSFNHTFDQVGLFHYYCTIHGLTSMFGYVQVLENANATDNATAVADTAAGTDAAASSEAAPEVSAPLDAPVATPVPTSTRRLLLRQLQATGSPALTIRIPQNAARLGLLGYGPSPQRVTAGQTVRFINDDTAPHTVTSVQTGLFDSGTLRNGQSWDHVFDTAGTFEYFCTIHGRAAMSGSLIVEEPQTTSESTVGSSSAAESAVAAAVAANATTANVTEATNTIGSLANTTSTAANETVAEGSTTSNATSPAAGVCGQCGGLFRSFTSAEDLSCAGFSSSADAQCSECLFTCGRAPPRQCAVGAAACCADGTWACPQGRSDANTTSSSGSLTYACALCQTPTLTSFFAAGTGADSLSSAEQALIAASPTAELDSVL